MSISALQRTSCALFSIDKCRSIDVEAAYQVVTIDARTDRQAVTRVATGARGRVVPATQRIEATGALVSSVK
ncbi:hypothetical protein, partial [Burkholderia vietnamiensis]|uniref:hypothetical protein n=1 Tax=Burkholderia vietnamiensis TaxID=60552 RepID=UPI001ABA2743